MAHKTCHSYIYRLLNSLKTSVFLPCYTGLEVVPIHISVAVQSTLKFCSCFLRSDLTEGMVFCLLGVLCVLKAAACAKIWSLIQRGPAVCVCVCLRVQFYVIYKLQQQSGLGQSGAIALKGTVYTQNKNETWKSHSHVSEDCSRLRRCPVSISK
jgi:hypothetical protein